jgi:hypothetical protein
MVVELGIKLGGCKRWRLICKHAPSVHLRPAYSNGTATFRWKLIGVGEDYFILLAKIAKIFIVAKRKIE